jgi:hypothetical protein
VQPFLRDRRVVPVAPQGERFLETAFVERLQQIVNDLVAKAGNGELHFIDARRHDYCGVRKAIPDLRREPDAVAPSAPKPHVAHRDRAGVFGERGERASSRRRVAGNVAQV